ncbi:MAG: transposase [Prevotella sp.]|nr:transposase [Prevotella sp.]
MSENRHTHYFPCKEQWQKYAQRRLATHIPINRRRNTRFECHSHRNWGDVRPHIHILTSLPKAMPLTDFVRDIKSNSSKWIKQQHPDYKLFAWQDGYAALSVSPGILDKTISYIRRQNEHHQKRTFEEEYKMFLEHYGIAYNERYVISD